MKLILFDGYCGLCNKFVDYVLRKDATHIFKLAPIQGETAAQVIATHSLKVVLSDPSSIIYIDGDIVYEKSDAVLHIMSKLSKVGALYNLLFYVPKIIRNPSYELIAKYRYKIFGKQQSCRMPTKEEKDRLLP